MADSRRQGLGEGWVAQELRLVRFGDKRLRDRLIRIVEDLAASPTASVPAACGQWAATKATYRFWDSDRVTQQPFGLAIGR